MIDHLGIPHDPEAFKEDFRGKIKLHKGGSSAPSTTTTISKSEPPDYVKPYSIQLMNRAGSLSNSPYQAYTGQRTADFTDQHELGLQMAQDRAYYGSPLMNASQQQGLDTLSGNYLGPGYDAYNPYLGASTGNYNNSYIGGGGFSASNPYINRIDAGNIGYSNASNPYINRIGTSNISTGQNALLGLNNPYLNSAISQAQSEVTDQYKNVTAPQLASAQVTQGAFGNTGLQQMQNKALSDLTSNLGNISTDMRMQDYGLQAQLGESDLGRRLQADSTNAANQLAASQARAAMYGDLSQFNAGQQQAVKMQNAANNLAESQARAQMYGNLSQFNAGLGQQAWQSNLAAEQAQDALNAGNRAADLTRNLAGYETQFDREQSAWDAERDNQMRTMSLANQFADNDWTDIQHMLGTGDVLRDYNQTQLNQQYDDWLAKSQWPYQQLDTLANAIRTSMGGGGSMVTSSPNAYQANSTANILGGSMLGYGIGDQFGYGGMGALGGGLLGLWG